MWLFSVSLLNIKKNPSTQLCSLSIQAIPEKIESNKLRLLNKNCCNEWCIFYSIMGTTLWDQNAAKFSFFVFATICNISE